MHYDVLVLLSQACPDLHGTIRQRLLPFKADEDGVVHWRWDWYKIGGGPFSDPAVTALFSELDESVKTCICRVGLLPADYSVAALLTPDGAWHDIEDFGWRVIDEGSEKNAIAHDLWRKHFRQTVAKFHGAIGVEVRCHG